MALTVITPPAALPLSLAEVRAQCRLTDDDDQPADDALIIGYIRAGTNWVDGPDGWLGRCLITQTLRLTIDAFPKVRYGWGIRLPCPPFQAVSSFTYLDESGTAQSVDSGIYRVIGAGSSEPARIVLMDGQWWPIPGQSQGGAVTITYTAGFGDDHNSVPEAIRQGLMMLVAYWYNQRETALIDPMVTEVPFSVKALLGTYKIYGF